MNNCALNLSASVIATAQLSPRHTRHGIVSQPCNYYTLCLCLGWRWVEVGGRWVAGVGKQKHTPTSSAAAFHEE